MDEPGELQLHAVARSGEVDVELRWYDDWESWGMHPAEEYRLVARCTTKTHRIRHQVLNLLQSIRDQFGLDGYKVRWVEHEFPDAELQRLKSVGGQNERLEGRRNACRGSAP